MATRRFEESAPVRRKLVARFDVDTRRELDRLAKQVGLRSVGGVPRDAELVRALLVCALLEHEPPAVRLAFALHVNTMAILAGVLGASVDGLHKQVKATAAGLANAEERDLVQATAAGVLRTTGRLPPARIPDRSRVHLALDGWLYRALRHRSEADDVAGSRPRALGPAVVRVLLQAALASKQAHQPVLVAYVKAIARMRTAIEAAVAREVEEVARALRGIA